MAGCCWGDLCVDRGELSKLPALSLGWQVQTAPLVSGEKFPLAVRFPPGAGAFEQHREFGLIGPEAKLSRPVHPVQLYEAILALAACVFLHSWFEKRRWPGQVISLWILIYGVIRFGTEFFRADNSPSYVGLNLSQIISLAFAIVATLLLTSRHLKVRPAFAVQEKNDEPAQAPKNGGEDTAVSLN